MSASTQLFELIKSLNQGEKWRFRLYSRRHYNAGESSYLKLFDAIDRQANYDEEGLKKKFRKAAFVKHFAVTKAQLYKLILDSLAAYSDDTAEQQCDDVIRQVKLLFNKGLAAQAHKLLKKARKVAAANELLLENLRLIRWERRLIKDFMEPTQAAVLAASLSEEEQRLLEDHKNLLVYEALLNELAQLQRQHSWTKESLEYFKPVYHHPLMKDESCARTIRARHYFYCIRPYYYLMMEEKGLAYADFRRNIKLMEEHHQCLADDMTGFLIRYISEVGNYLNVATTQCRFDDYFEQKLESLKLFPLKMMGKKPLPEGLRFRIFIDYYLMRLKWVMLVGELEAGRALVPEIEKGLQGERILPQYRPLAPWLQVGVMYFVSGMYDKALDWLNGMPDTMRNMNTYPQIYTWIRMFYIVIYYELGQEYLLESSIKNLYRYLLLNTRTGKHQMDNMERMLFRFFRRNLSKALSKRQEKKLFEALLKEMLEQTGGSYANEYASHLYWLESKVTGRHIADIYKESSRKISQRLAAEHADE